VIAVRTLDARIRPRLEAWKKDKRIATTTNHQPIARRFERAVLANGSARLGRVRGMTLVERQAVLRALARLMFGGERRGKAGGGR
jgi:hypothetical protein